ncbi:hypothetical protein GCM10010517_72370 [Streptosporangium fragile]|uniref:Flavoprotein domain-containing protein n=1 Tax=Streptosporangium fragile TaxID=46186 RepID=A0ABP6IR73_9ACTN
MSGERTMGDGPVASGGPAAGSGDGPGAPPATAGLAADGAAPAAGKVLYAIVTGAPPARDVDVLVRLAHADGWRVCVVASPDGARFLDEPALAELTGHPVLSRYRKPGETQAPPPPDAMLVAPATCNTLVKWSAGISDTLALGLIVEAIGRRIPLVAVPFSNWAHMAHPAVGESVARLRSWGVTVLLGDEVYPLHDPGPSDKYAPLFPWRLAWQAVSTR